MWIASGLLLTALNGTALARMPSSLSAAIRASTGALNFSALCGSTWISTFSADTAPAAGSPLLPQSSVAGPLQGKRVQPDLTNNTLRLYTKLACSPLLDPRPTSNFVLGKSASFFINTSRISSVFSNNLTRGVVGQLGFLLACIRFGNLLARV